MKTIMSIVVALAVVAGGAGGTIAAAQSSMPDDLLYPVKILSEDARLDLAGDSEDALQLSMQFVARRMTEIQTMLQDGETPPEAVTLRLQAQVENALRLAVNQSDDQAVMALNQIREQLRTETELMAKLQVSGDPSLAQAQMQIQVMLQNALQQAGQGAEDPTMLRQQLNQNTGEVSQDEAPGAQFGTPDPNQGSDNGNPDKPSDTGNGNGSGNGSKP